MAKELTPISVETLPNGYGLTVHGKQFLYFDETELFEGLCYHAGMAIMKETDKDVIRDVVANLLAGDTRKLMDRNQEQQNEMVKLEDKISKLKSENEKLEGKIKRLEKKYRNNGINRNLIKADITQRGSQQAEWQSLEDC